MHYGQHFTSKKAKLKIGPSGFKSLAAPAGIPYFFTQNLPGLLAAPCKSSCSSRTPLPIRMFPFGGSPNAPLTWVNSGRDWA